MAISAKPNVLTTVSEGATIKQESVLIVRKASWVITVKQTALLFAQATLAADKTTAIA
jgi:hypothetical protein